MLSFNIVIAPTRLPGGLFFNQRKLKLLYFPAARALSTKARAAGWQEKVVRREGEKA
jgi:hypothetical protein